MARQLTPLSPRQNVTLEMHLDCYLTKATTQIRETSMDRACCVLQQATATRRWLRFSSLMMCTLNLGMMDGGRQQ